MANAITKDTFWEEYYIGHLNKRIWIEGYKASGIANNNSVTNALACTALSGNVEENIKLSGTQGTITGWQASHLYELGEVCKSVVGVDTYWHRVVSVVGSAQSGNSGATEPSWNSSFTGATTDNQLTWRNFEKNPIRMYDNNGNTNLRRNVLVDDTKDFRLDMTSMMVEVNTTTNEVVTYNGRGAVCKNVYWDDGDIPDGENYEVHGTEKTLSEVTDFMKVFQGNMIIITSGTGEGQVRVIKSVYDDGTQAWLIPWFPFTVAPDFTSTFIIAWSPMDIIYQSDISGWGAGDLVFTEDGHRLLIVRMKDHILEIGNNGTTTYFGYAGYVWSVSVPHGGVSGWGNPAGTRNDESRMYLGDANYGNGTTDTPAKIGYEAVFSGNGGTWAWMGHFLSTESDAEQKRAGGIQLGRTVFGSKNTHALFTGNASGKLWSFHNQQLGEVPATTNSISDYIFYKGGNWTGPFPISIPTYNTIVSDIRGENIDNSIANWSGLKWLGVNQTGNKGDYFVEQRNSNMGVANFLDSDGYPCDWWYRNNDNNGGIWQWFEKKSADLTIVDSQDATLKIKNANITIKNANGDIVSERDSGADLAEDLTSGAINILTTDSTVFELGDTIRINNEYMIILTKPDSTHITVTRGVRYPTQAFRATVHEHNTPGMDDNIYIIGAQTTDANGQIDTQWLTAFSLLTDDNKGYASEVTVDGINYTIVSGGNHRASIVKKPPSIWWQTGVGAEGFPWVINKLYTDGAIGGISWTNHSPFTITIQKPGYDVVNTTFTPTIDTEASEKTIKLKRKRFIEPKVLE